MFTFIFNNDLDIIYRKEFLNYKFSDFFIIVIDIQDTLEHWFVIFKVRIET